MTAKLLSQCHLTAPPSPSNNVMYVLYNREEGNRAEAQEEQSERMIRGRRKAVAKMDHLARDSVRLYLCAAEWSEQRAQLHIWIWCHHCTREEGLRGEQLAQDVPGALSHLAA